MSNNGVNNGRRRVLTAMTAAVAGVGAVGVVIPFIGSWNPSARAKAAGAPVKADVSKIEPGGMIIVEWRGKPVFVVRRTKEALASLEQITPSLKDPESQGAVQPDYIDSAERAIKPEILVMLGICTHLGCVPKFRPDVGAADLGGDKWLGGFFCPCHGSKFDLAGRVYSGVPAPTNLEIPPYRYDSDNVIVIGEDQENA
ncbi:MAG: ubiquinol-cytochrome c reductase iron-sulfur subunit [Pseudomonadales bacterium]